MILRNLIEVLGLQDIKPIIFYIIQKKGIRINFYLLGLRFGQTHTAYQQLGTVIPCEYCNRFKKVLICIQIPLK